LISGTNTHNKNMVASSTLLGSSIDFYLNKDLDSILD
jgi:hypothetical protein